MPVLISLSRMKLVSYIPVVNPIDVDNFNFGSSTKF